MAGRANYLACSWLEFDPFEHCKEWFPNTELALGTTCCGPKAKEKVKEIMIWYI